MLFFSLFWNHLKQFIKKNSVCKISKRMCEDAFVDTAPVYFYFPMISSVLYDKSSLISDFILRLLGDQMKNAKISPNDWISVSPPLWCSLYTCTCCQESSLVWSWHFMNINLYISQVYNRSFSSIKKPIGSVLGMGWYRYRYSKYRPNEQ